MHRNPVHFYLTGRRRPVKRPPVTVKDVWRALDEHYPVRAQGGMGQRRDPRWAIPAAPVRSIAIALTATPAVLAALRRRPADLLVTHHPVVFSPLKVDPPGPPLLLRGVRAAAGGGLRDLRAHQRRRRPPRGVARDGAPPRPRGDPAAGPRGAVLRFLQDRRVRSRDARGRRPFRRGFGRRGPHRRILPVLVPLRRARGRSAGRRGPSRSRACRGGRSAWRRSASRRWRRGAWSRGC